MKKLMAITLAVMLVFSAVAVGYAAPKWGMPPGQEKKLDNMARFDDLDDDNWAAQTIYELVDIGKLKGYGNGKFMPNKPVTKLESLVMLYEAADAEIKDFEAADYGLYKGPDWGIGYYAWAFENGAFGDSAKLFNANAAITRAEFAFYAANLEANFEVNDDQFDWDAFGNQSSRFDDEEELGEYREQIRWMSANRLMIGDDQNMFHGGGVLKRCEAAMVMHRLVFFDYGEVSEPYARIDIEAEDGCITSLDPEITITFSELVYDDYDYEDEIKGDDFYTSSAKDVIAFLIKDGSKLVGVDFEVTEIDREDSKEIWTIKPDEELSTGSAYRIQLKSEDFYDGEGNNLRKDVTETFSTCESYDMTATYEAELEFYEDDSEDWLDFTIDVDANDDDGTEVKLVFDLPDGVSVQYQDGSDWEYLENGDVYDDDGFELSDGIVEYFRASFASPGAYVIPVEFIDIEADPGEEELFTLIMEMGRVTLADESEGLAGNGVIYDLSTGTEYMVTEIDDGDETVYYTNSEGELEEDVDDMEALDDVEMIIDLDNSLEYLVEVEEEE